MKNILICILRTFNVLCIGFTYFELSNNSDALLLWESSRTLYNVVENVEFFLFLGCSRQMRKPRSTNARNSRDGCIAVGLLELLTLAYSYCQFLLNKQPKFVIYIACPFGKEENFPENLKKSCRCFRLSVHQLILPASYQYTTQICIIPILNGLLKVLQSHSGNDVAAWHLL